MTLSWSRLSDTAEPVVPTAPPAPEQQVDPVRRPGRLEAFDEAFTSAGIGFWIFSPRSGAFVVSGGLGAIYRRAFSDVAETASLFDALFGPAPDASLRAAWDAAWRGEGLFDREHELERPDGSTRWARSLVSVTFGPDGAADRVYGLAIDIDEQKRREAAYRAAKEAAETASRNKSEFVATMSHEIRTPLNGIMGMAQILAQTELDANQRACLDTVASSGRALMSILNDSIDLSRIEAGEVELHEDAFDLETLVRDTVAGASGVAVQQGVDVGHSVAAECAGEAYGDADRLRQILSNLVFNALKFTERGSVTVRVAPGAEGRVKFMVQDTGPGIPEAELGRIFERFRQTRSEESGKRRGSGLGLTISKNLVELMGGRIGVESLVNVGSTFWFELPLSPPTAPETEDEDEVVDGADSDDARDGEGGGAEAWVDDGATRILVAEDDPTNQKVFAMALEPSGYVVEFAQNGLEAVQALMARRFDLVLMDINMPVMSGEEAIRQIRGTPQEEDATEGAPADTPWRQTPIIVVTALTSRDSRRYYCELGATDYLPKPLDIALLMKKTANLIGAPAQAE